MVSQARAQLLEVAPDRLQLFRLATRGAKCGFRHRARFFPGDALQMRDLFDLTAHHPSTEVLIDDRPVPYARELWLPLAGVGALILAVIWSRRDFFETVLRSRINTEGASSSTHFDVYRFVPDVLGQHPLFGLGLNNFSVYYEFVTGRTNFGPHSFYVATIVETGLVGTLLFGWFLWYLFRRLGRLREIGRTLASPRIRPLAWGLTAALVGTIAANA